MDQARTKRHNPVEVLRIIAMLMIILGHFMGHGNGAELALGANKPAAETLRVLVQAATNIYVLIGSYYMINYGLKLSRLFILWAQVAFFSVACYLVCVGAGWEKLSMTAALKAVLPLSGNQYWFATTYFGLCLLAPFVSRGLKALSKSAYQVLLGILLAVFVLWKTVLPFAETLNPAGGNSILWFLTLFVIAGYIRLHAPKRPGRVYAVGALISAVVLVLGYFAIQKVSLMVGLDGKGTWIASNFDSVPVTALSVCVFLLFLRQPDKASPALRRLTGFFASSTFSVYLIHENPFLRKQLWTVMPRIYTPFAAGWCYIPMLVGLSLGIFLICTLADKVTWQLLRKLLRKLKFSKAQAWLDAHMNSAVSSGV